MSYDPRKCGAACDICPLQGSPVVPPEPNTGATIVLVGEAPGEQEEKRESRSSGRPATKSCGLSGQRSFVVATST